MPADRRELLDNRQSRQVSIAASRDAPPDNRTQNLGDRSGTRAALPARAWRRILPAAES